MKKSGLSFGSSDFLFIFAWFIHSLKTNIMYQIIYDYRQKRRSFNLAAESFTDARETFKQDKRKAEIVAVRRCNTSNN